MVRKPPSSSVSLSLCAAFILALTTPSLAQPETILYTFVGGTDAALPFAGLTLGSGIFYGTTGWGGQNNGGTVFKLDHGNETVIYSFSGGADGVMPQGPVIRDAAGNLYGTTKYGGTSNAGTVFKIDAAGNESLLYAFAGAADGAHRLGALIRDNHGNLYGTTSAGGDTSCSTHSQGCGTLYRLSPTRKFTVLHTFGAGADGQNPQAGLIADSAGNFYGTTQYGGASDDGTVFKVAPSGHESVLYSFKWELTDGAQPSGSLLRDATGNLYGTTQVGGNPNKCDQFGCGTVFKLDASGVETILYAFSGEPDGAVPVGGLVMDSAGILYGTTHDGGSSGFGTVFKVDAIGNEIVLYSFTGGKDGSTPWGNLLHDQNGNLYGSTSTGGDINAHAGVLFKIKL